MGSEKQTADKNKGNKIPGAELDLLAHQISLLSPICPPDIIADVTKTLSGYGSEIFSELLDSFGAADNSRKKRYIRRETSHVSSDDEVWMINERRRGGISRRSRNY